MGSNGHLRSGCSELFLSIDGVGGCWRWYTFTRLLPYLGLIDLLFILDTLTVPIHMHASCDLTLLTPRQFIPHF